MGLFSFIFGKKNKKVIDACEFDADGYNAQGFNAEGYNREGFDRTGYNKEGYNKLGYDRQGYDQSGFNKLGYDRLGFNNEGYNDCGFDRMGYNKKGFDVNGFNTSGFDSEGYDFNGYSKNGYDRQGYNKEGYNQFGYNRDGFNKNGYDMDGYDIEGYDVNGFSKSGYNREGYNKYGYDAEGINKSGFNNLGYDRNSFDVKDFDSSDYDKDGFNAEGYSKEGFDRKGYDKEGYNVYGFDYKGYDREGFNKHGFNKKGYDREGFDLNGYNEFKLNREGFDCKGYNTQRYNASGYSIIGYNKNGFDSDGFDYQGYNCEGYNKDGYNRKGFNQYGFNIYNHHFKEYNDEGFLKETGFNDLGYNADGFDNEGYDSRGYDASGFDRKGYMETGFDRNGYDREGYNSDGYNQLGYNRAGYNLDGFDENGFDHEGYDRNGFNLSGYDQSGYDAEGYDIYGYDRKGFTAEENRLLNNKKTKVSELKEGDIIYSNVFGPLEIIYRFEDDLYVIGDKLDAKPFVNALNLKEFALKNQRKNLESSKYGSLIFYKEYDKDFVYGSKIKREAKHFKTNAFDAKDKRAPVLFLNVPESWIQAEDAFDETVFEQEIKHLNNVVEYAKDYYLKELKKKIEKKYQDKFKVENPMFYTSFNSDASYRKTADVDYERIKGLINKEIYFASFVLNGEKIYLGRNEITSTAKDIQVISWTDKKMAQYYYQYDVYVGNKELNLSLVRDYTIVHNRLFMYFDKFNDSVDQIAKDDRMTKLLQAHRNDKRVTDIVNSIQKQQYEIMTQDLNEELIVLGCAGSGKTMILFHRLSYILSNFELDIHDVFLISPTNLLTIQTDQLSKTLNVDKANRLTVQEFVFDIYQQYCDEYDIYQTLIGLDHADNFIYDLKYFDLAVLKDYVSKTENYLNSKEYLDKEYHRLYNALNQMKKLIINNDEIKTKQNKEKKINEYLELNEKSLAECRKYSFKNIELMQESLMTHMEDLEEYAESLELIQLFKKYGLLTGIYTESQRAIIKQVKSDNALISNILNPLFTLTRGYDIGELNLMTFESSKSLIEYLITNSKLLMKYAIEDIQELVENTVIISEELADEMIRICQKAHREYSVSKKHYDILEYLKYSNYISKKDETKNGEVYGVDLNSYKKLNKTFELFDRFEWNQSIEDKYQLTEEIINPFDFYDAYQYLIDRNNRFKEFKAGNHEQYIFDLIFDLINPQKSIYKKSIKVGYSQLFALTYVLVNIYGLISESKKIIFIDEFQDLAPSEILMLRATYPTSIFNYYGDVLQCMNDKGIKQREMLRDILPDIKMFDIMVNYRNAQEITQYVNQQMPFADKMIPTGIKGVIKEVLNDEKEIRHALKYAESDRVAFIVKDKSSVEESLSKTLELIDIEHYEATNIPRGRVMLYSIQEAKGLEFDVVLVDSQNMNINEKYVAYTRALNKLFVI